MKKRVLLITPPFHAGVVEVAGRWVPLHLVYLAGSLKEAGYEPIIYDAMTKMVGHREIEKKIEELKPHYVATTSITCTLPDALEILKRAKKVEPSIKTIIGGIHPTFMYEEVLALSEYVDYIVRGEGERTIVELLDCLEAGREPAGVKGLAYRSGGRVVVTEERQLMSPEELDSLPKAWELLDWEDYRYFVIPDSRLGALDTSRGCNKECSFCSQRMFWRQTWRPRSPESLVEDIRVQHHRFGVNVVLLTDDYPTYDRERWERFLDLLIEESLDVFILMETRVEDILRDRDILHKYRKAGVIHIYVGIESGEQSTIDVFKKDISVADAKTALRLLNDHGIITETSLILGLPEDTIESIEKNLRMAVEYNPDFCHFLAIAPWPYAEMYETLSPYIKVKDYRRYNLIDPVVKPENLSLEEIDRAIVDCYRRFYMGKLREVVSIKDDFKRDYMLEAMRLMMRSSFLVEKMGDLGKVPEEVEKYLGIMREKAEKKKAAM